MKKQRQKNEKHKNEYIFGDGLENYDDIVCQNEENSYEIMNYKLDNYDIGAYDQINYNELNVKTNKTVEKTQILK